MNPFTEANLTDTETQSKATEVEPDLAWCAPITTQWLLSGYPHEGAPLQEVTLRARVAAVGRHADNTLRIPNPTVSNRHAELRLAGASLIVVDRDSTNGTFVNGHRIQDTTELNDGDVLQFGTAVYKVRASMGAPVNATVALDAAQIAVGHILFDKLLNEPAVVPHYQPIVQLENAECVGYEVLARSKLRGLKTPLDMFRVASERCMESQLSELLRTQGVRIGQQLNSTLYLNTHPSEIGHPELIKSLEELREEFATIPLILEIHEATITSSTTLARLQEQLTDLNIGLAYDDFGAGQARLRELADAPPDVIKFDICLIRGLPQASKEHKKLLRSLIEAVKELNVTALAEGVETQEEANACRELGFELAQGYFFGRPAAIDKQKDPAQGVDYISWAISQTSP